MLTAISWLVSALVNYFVFYAIGVELPFVAAIFLLLVVHVGIAVPSSPGRIGVFHYLCILALSVFEIDRGVAVGYGAVLYLIVFVPPSVLGLLFVSREKLTLDWLRQAIRNRHSKLADASPGV